VAVLSAEEAVEHIQDTLHPLLLPDTLLHRAAAEAAVVHRTPRTPDYRPELEYETEASATVDEIVDGTSEVDDDGEERKGYCVGMMERKGRREKL